MSHKGTDYEKLTICYNKALKAHYLLFLLIVVWLKLNGNLN